MRAENIKKITHISDTHGYHQFLDGIIDTDTDIICHSGDFSNGWGDHDYRSFLHWYAELPYKKILISGNHELKVEKDPNTFLDMCKDLDIIYLHHENRIIDGIKFFGSPYTPAFNNWAYNVDRTSLEDYWNEIDIDTDVLLTHGPPFGIGDRCGFYDTKLVGDVALLQQILYLKSIRGNKPLIHQFGHIHEDSGEFNAEAIGRFYKPINASFMNANYEPNPESVTISFFKVNDDFS